MRDAFPERLMSETDPAALADFILSGLALAVAMGGSIEPRLKSAAPVEQTFLLTK